MKNKALSLIENLCEIKLSHVYYQCGGRTDSHAQEAQTSWRAKRENEKNCLSFVPPSALPSFRFVILQKTLYYTLYTLYNLFSPSRRCMTRAVSMSPPSPGPSAAQWM